VDDAWPEQEHGAVYRRSDIELDERRNESEAEPGPCSGQLSPKSAAELALTKRYEPGSCSPAAGHRPQRAAALADSSPRTRYW